MDNSTQLSPLLEVSGVEVAFVVDQNGKLVAHQGMPVFTPDLLQRAGSRIMTLIGGLSEYLRPAQEATLVYDQHLIILRRRENLILAVLAQNQVNQVALKLAGNLCLKRVAEPAPTDAPSAPVAPTPAAPASPSRQFGGWQAPTKAQPAVPPKKTPPPKRGGGIWG